jgi:hypothetical protein
MSRLIIGTMPQSRPPGKAATMNLGPAARSSERLRETAVGVWPALLVAVIVFVRDPTPLLRAEFWAEDGPEFFAAALTHGIQSLWTPVYGYHFLASRMIAYTATWLPVVWTPYIYAWSCLAMSAVTAAYFSRDGFSWLIPSRWMRILTCTVLAVGPGTSEVFSSLCNLPSPLTLLGLLMLLEKPFAVSGRKMVALIMLFLSAGQMFLLMPLIASLFWITRNHRYLVLLCVLVLLTVANVIGNHTQAAEAGYRNYGALEKVPAIFAAQFFLRSLVAPFLGSALTGYFMRAPAEIFWPGIAVSIWWGAWIISRFKSSLEKVALLGLAYFLVSGTFVVIALSRNYALHQILRESADVMWNHRYSYLPGSVAILFWFSVVSSPAIRWAARTVTAAVLILITFHNASRFRHDQDRPDLNWAKTADHIQSALDLQKAHLLDRPIRVEGIEVHPRDYRYRFFSVTVNP